jgi:hypothetical protein
MSQYAQRIVDAYKIVDGSALNERKLWLQDDYVKFIRHAQRTIEQAGFGVLGFITNHGYLDNPTFRGMRQSLMQTFGRLHVLDLHGNALKKERAPDGTEDKNVFEIRQGVAIVTGEHGSPHRVVRRGDLWGTSELKFAWLASHSVSNTHWKAIKPTTPFYFFQSVDDKAAEAYNTWPSLSELMPTYSSGVITARDELVLDYEADPILDRIMLLRDANVSDQTLRQQLFKGKSSPKYAPGDSRGWKLPAARRKLREDRQWRDRVAPCLYRPFNLRCVYMAEWMVDWSRPEIRRHLELHENPVLVFPRNTGAGKPWDHAFVSYAPILGRFFPDSACITYMAPMLVMSPGILGQATTLAANFSASQTWALNGEHELRMRARQKLGYIYSILHSPTYRARYLPQLRADFPRIPKAEDASLLRSLSELGDELVALHLLQSPKLDRSTTEYFGDQAREVEQVSWSMNSVYIDKAQTTGFKGVREEVWNFHIGGYQVCEKWLKDRKGRMLSKDDIVHYQKVVVALSETIRLMKEIDEVIEQHGGWPGAFASPSATDTPAGQVDSEGESRSLPREQDRSGPSDDAHDDASGDTAAPLLFPNERAETVEVDRPRPSTPAIGTIEKEQIICVIRDALEASADIERDSLTRDVARRLGFQRAGSRIAEMIDDAIRTAVRRDIAASSSGRIRLYVRHITEYDRDQLKHQFLASLGQTWTDRDDAIRSFARWMGFQRAGPKIDETSRSLINGLIREGRLESDGPRIRRLMRS